MPLIVLAILSVFGGWLGPAAALNPFPVEDAHSNSFDNFLAPVLHGVHHEVGEGTERGLALVATGDMLVGAWLAYLIYVRRPKASERIRASIPRLHDLVANKFYVDELFDAVLVRPLIKLSDAVLFRSVDAGLIDAAAVNGTARAVRSFTGVLKHLQTGLAQGYLLMMVLGTLLIVGYLLR